MAVTFIDTASLPEGAWSSGDLPGGNQPLVLRGSETIALADTYADLFAVVFGHEEPARGGADGYADRYAAALRLAQAVNTDALALARAEGADLTPDDEAGLARARPDEEAFAGEWAHPYPLVLLRTDYAPFTEVEVPPGAFVVMIDPFTYSTLLDSMARADILELDVRGEAPDGPGPDPDEFVVGAVDEIVEDTDATLRTFVAELLREVEETGQGPAWLAATLSASGEEGASEADIADGFLVWFVDSTGETVAGREVVGAADEDPSVAAARLALLLLAARESARETVWDPGPASPADVVAGAVRLVDVMAASLRA